MLINMKFQHIALALIVLVLFTGVVWVGFIKKDAPAINYTPPSETVWESSYSNASNDLIVIESHTAGNYIASPVTVTGRARGYWFFEASFPVVLVNWDGLIIAEGIAQAQDEWMTEEFVPFSVTLTFEKPLYNERGALIFKRDNPSGLPENDAALEMPIRFE